MIEIAARIGEWLTQDYPRSCGGTVSAASR